MPKVSVLMPIYKTNPQYLKEAIQSVLNQTFTDFEFLILDDCPGDDREEVVKSFQDTRIKYLKNEKNLGITPSRNKLIDLATGEYLAVMDHDDICLPTRFEEEVKVLNEHPEIGVVGTGYQTFPKEKAIYFPEKDEDIQMYLTSDCYLLHPSSMIRKSVLMQNNLKYEEEFSPCEDYALWGRLIGKTHFYNIPKILFRYRIHETNTHKAQSDRMKDNSQKVRAFIQTEHPNLWNKLNHDAPYIVRMKLFGIIPCGKFVQFGSECKGILKRLPFLSLKIKLEVK